MKNGRQAHFYKLLCLKHPALYQLRYCASKNNDLNRTGYIPRRLQRGGAEGDDPFRGGKR